MTPERLNELERANDNMEISQARVEELIDFVRALLAINSKFVLTGTDGCMTYETGRVTLFVANRQCIGCAPETYTKEWARKP